MRKGSSALLLTLLVGIIVISGCVEQSDISGLVKQTELGKEFLAEYPNAKITAVLLSEEAVAGIIDDIREDCDPSIPVKSYWKVRFYDPDSGIELVAWIDGDTQDLICIVSEGGPATTTTTTTVKHECYSDNDCPSGYKCIYHLSGHICLFSPPPNSAECIDSDGGKNYYEKGVTKGTFYEYHTTDTGSVAGGSGGGGAGVITYTDTCSQSPAQQWMLYEYYCEGEQVKNIAYDCPKGCENGACLKESECTDSDGGIDKFTYGVVEYGQKRYGDYCPSTHPGYIIEYYCDNDIVDSEKLLCPGGTTCIEGVCKYDETPDEECVDSDEGIDFYVKGTATGIRAITDDDEVATYIDTCGTTPLQYDRAYDYYCDDSGYVSTAWYDCPDGCYDGVCLQHPTEEKNIELYPYDSDVDHCINNKGVQYPATGEGYANWFVWNGCAKYKYYYVNPGEEIRLHVKTDSCDGCVCYYPSFYVYEYVNGNWEMKTFFDFPWVKGHEYDEYYTPESDRIKIYASKCFYLRIYSENPVESDCVDTEDGIDLFVKGAASGKLEGIDGTANYMDVCYINVWYPDEPYNIKESYCDGNHVVYEYHECPNGCENSACMPSVTTTTTLLEECMDSDGGIMYYDKGVVVQNSKEYADFCFPGTNGIAEYYCEDGQVKAIGKSCGSVITCEDGACVSPPDPTTTTTTFSTTSTTTTTIPPYCGNGMCEDNEHYCPDDCGWFWAHGANSTTVTYKDVDYTVDLDYNGCGPSGSVDLTFKYGDVTQIDTNQLVGYQQELPNGIVFQVNGIPCSVDVVNIEIVSDPILEPITCINATDTAPCVYQEYEIYPNLGNPGSWARLVVTNTTDGTYDMVVLSEGEIGNYFTLDLDIKLLSVSTLGDGSIIYADIMVGYLTSLSLS